MHEQHLTAIAHQLKVALGHGTLHRLGEESGFIIRERTVTAGRFVPSLIKSLASTKVESIADLVRDFNHDHGLTVFYKPYYEKLDTPCFARLMKNMFESMLNALFLPVLAPLRNGPFVRFRDILLQDGTSFALHDGLAEAFPGRFTKVSPAAVELHCTMSLFSDNLVTVVMTGDAECERHHLPDPEELTDILILGDRGYDSTEYMQRVDDAGGAFLMRLRKNLNPRVIKIHQRGRRYRDLEGKRLHTVLRRLPKGTAFDLDVCREDARGTRRCNFRLVVSWSPKKREWMRLISNLDRDSFSKHDLIQVYRLRWQIELLFKELKSYANLHKFSTTKVSIAEGLMWASLCAAFLKRYIAHACQWTSGQAISTRRVAMCGRHVVDGVLCALQRPFLVLVARLREMFVYLCHNAIRPTTARERKTGRLAIGLRLAGVTF